MNQANPTRITAIVADDETLGRNVIRHMLEAHSDVEVVRECATGRETSTAIEDLKPDVVFLDIKMPDMDGIQVATKLDNKSLPIVVFVTAHGEYALQAFDQNAIDYLLKPFDQERFDQTITRVRERLAQRSDALFTRKLKGFLEENDRQPPPPSSKPAKQTSSVPTNSERLAIKETGRVSFIDTHEIDYLKASGNYTAVHVEEKRHLVYGTLTHMLKKLDANKFVRIHRSTVVNTQRIKELQPHFNGEYVVILKDGIRLKLSRGYRNQARRIMGLE